MFSSLKNSLALPVALAAGVGILLATGWLIGPVSPTSDDWMPLDAGLELDYDVVYETTEPRPPEVWRLRNEGEIQWVLGSAWVRHHSAGVRFLLVQDEGGIRRVAHQTLLDAEPLPDEQPIWVIKSPYAVGTEWTTTTTPHLIRRRNEYPAELKNTHQAQMLWRIESDRANVRLADGQELQPCLLLEGVAVITLYVDGLAGFRDVELISREWYCKGIGLARLEREEQIPTGQYFTGGRLVASLRRAPSGSH